MTQDMPSSRYLIISTLIFGLCIPSNLFPIMAIIFIRCVRNPTKPKVVDKLTVSYLYCVKAA